VSQIKPILLDKKRLKMKKSLIIIALILAPINLLSQMSATDAFKLKQAGSLYDERGYSKNNMPNGENLNVSKVNGNLIYSVPISSTKVNGYPFEVSLNYNGSVSFTSFSVCDKETGVWSKFHQNRPLWILGVNGFAVQTLSSAGMFFCDPEYSDFHIGAQYEDKNRWNDSNLTFMVEGYDYCNRVDAHKNTMSQDVIKLLRSDGSVLELRNPKSLTQDSEWTDPQYHTGRYYEVGANTNGYAEVSYDLSAFNLYLHNYLGTEHGGDDWDFNSKNDSMMLCPRIVKYYPGDGLEYVFHEWKTPYGLLSLKTEDESGYIYEHGGSEKKYTLGYVMNNYNATYTSGVCTWGSFASPNIFYLREINNPLKNMVSFDYSRHEIPAFVDYWGNENTDFSAGRANLLGFTGHSISYGIKKITIKAFDKIMDVVFDNVKQNGATPDGWNDGMDGLCWDIQEPGTLLQNGLYFSHIGYVNRIYSEGKTIEFEYDNYTKTFDNIPFPSPHSENDNDITLENLRLSKIVEPDKSIIVGYFSDSYLQAELNDFDIIDPNTYNSFSTYLNNFVDSLTYKVGDNTKKIKTYGYSTYGLQPGGVPGTLIKTYDMVDNKVITENYKWYKHNLGYMVWNPGPGTTGNEYHDYVVSTSLAKKESTVDGNLVIEHHHPVFDSLHFRTLDTLVKVIYKDDNDSLIASITRKGYSWGVSGADTLDFGVDSVNLRIGQLLVADTVINYYPNDNDKILNFKINEYVNLDNHYDTLDVSFKSYDKIQTIQNYLNLLEQGDPLVAGKTWEEAWCLVMAFRQLDSLNVPVKFPKLFGLLKKSFNYNYEGNIINGQINTIGMEPFLQDGLSFVKGKVLRDSVFGKNGTFLTYRDYEYTPGYFVMGNVLFDNKSGLLKKVIDENGVEKIQYYNIAFAVANHQIESNDCNASLFPISKIINVMKDTLEYDMPISAYQMYNSMPFMNVENVRKFKFDSYLQLDTNDLYQMTTYDIRGNVIGTVDYNNWLTVANYNKYGQLRQINLPFDYSAPGGCYQNEPGDFFKLAGYTKTGCVAYQKTWEYSRVGNENCDSLELQVVLIDTNQAGPYSGYYTTEGRVSLELGEFGPESICVFPGDSIPKLQIENEIFEKKYKENKINKDKLKDDNSGKLLTFGQCDCIDTVTKSFNPYCTTSAHIGMRDDICSVQSIDSIIFIMNMESSATLDFELKIQYGVLSWETTYPYNDYFEVGFEHDFTLSSNFWWNDSIATNNRFMDVITDSSKIAYLKHQLIDQDREIRIEMSTTSEAVAWIWPEVEMRIYGDFSTPRDIFYDYTLKYDHSFSPLVSYQYSKIDDALHSSNIMSQDTANFAIRRNTQYYQFGHDYSLKEAKRISDNTKITNTYNGFGQVKTTTDQQGNVTTIAYDDWGRKKTVTNPGLPSTNYYYEIDPDFGITDQDFFGLCQLTTVTNGMNVKTSQYKDAFGRLRRTVVDSSGLSYTTKYEYDSTGQLILRSQSG
jgi:YD repeat-containing protein